SASATATATPTATSATSASASASTTSATAASGALSCAAGAGAASGCCEDEDPQGALLGRPRSPCPLEALAARSCGQPVAAARHDQAPELPGQVGDRPELNQTDNQNAERAAQVRPSPFRQRANQAPVCRSEFEMRRAKL